MPETTVTWLLGCDKKGLELILEHEQGKGRQYDPSIDHTVFQHDPLCTQKPGHRPDQKHPQDTDPDAAAGCYINKHRKEALGLFMLSLSQGLGDQRPASGSEHKAHSSQDH